jgi:hypothetical protein
VRAAYSSPTAASRLPGPGPFSLWRRQALYLPRLPATPERRRRRLPGSIPDPPPPPAMATKPIGLLLTRASPCSPRRRFAHGLRPPGPLSCGPRAQPRAALRAAQYLQVSPASGFRSPLSRTPKPRILPRGAHGSRARCAEPSPVRCSPSAALRMRLPASPLTPRYLPRAWCAVRRTTQGNDGTHAPLPRESYRKSTFRLPI